MENDSNAWIFDLRVTNHVYISFHAPLITFLFLWRKVAIEEKTLRVTIVGVDIVNLMIL